MKENMSFVKSKKIALCISGLYKFLCDKKEFVLSKQDAKYITTGQYESIFSDCNEITKMLVSTTKTIKNPKSKNN
jgi:hypothetical protein